MNELEKLLGLVDEAKKADAQKLFDAVKAFIGGLDTKINDNERLKNDAITSRDKIKTQLKEIGTKLGVNIDTDNVVEAIDAIKNTKGVKESELLIIKDKEIDNLKIEIGTLTTQVKDADKNASKQMLKMTLKTDIARLLPELKAKANATSYITDAVEKMAVFEDGKAVFKNADNTTLRIGGKDATVEDVIKQMKDKEVNSKESLFFDIGVQESGVKNKGGKEIKGDYTLKNS